MLSEREVISTLNMLRTEHLDVRTVTLGVSLFDCVSHDIELFIANVKDKILRHAAQLVRVCDEVGDKYGIPVVNKRISVSPIAVVAAPFGPSGMVRVCRALDDCAKEAGVDFLGGFSALVEKGFANGDRALIEALPEALTTTDRICSSINVASSRSGINMDAVSLMGEQILKVAQASADRGGIGCAKLVVFANIPQDVPFMAGAYLGVGEPDVVINVGVSGPGVVKKAIDRALGAGVNAQGQPLTLLDIAEVIKRTAYKVTRVGEMIGTEVAHRRRRPLPRSHARRGRQRGRNLPERGALQHRRARHHRRAGHAQRRRQEGRCLCLLLRGRSFRRVHPRFRRLQHRSRRHLRPPQPRKARSHDQRLLRGSRYDRHSRRYPRHHHRGHHRR